MEILVPVSSVAWAGIRDGGGFAKIW